MPNILTTIYRHHRLWNTMTCKMISRPRFWHSWRECFRLSLKRGNAIGFKSGALSQRRTDEFLRGENSLTGKKEKIKQQFVDPSSTWFQLKNGWFLKDVKPQVSASMIQTLLFKIYNTLFCQLKKESAVFVNNAVSWLQASCSTGSLSNACAMMLCRLKIMSVILLHLFIYLLLI